MRALIPCQAPQPEDLAPGGEASRAFVFEGQQGFRAGALQDWRKQRLNPWRAHTRFHVHWDPAQSNNSVGAWDGPTYRVLEGHVGRWGSAVAHWGARTLVAEATENIDQCELCRKSVFWHQDMALTNSLQATVLQQLRPNSQDRNTAPSIIRQPA